MGREKMIFTEKKKIANAKEKEIRLEKSLDLRNRLIEKGIVGVIVVIVALVANSALEKYKSEEKQSLFLLQSRLYAITEIRELNSKMHKIQHELIYVMPDDDTETMLNKRIKLLQYQNILEEFVNVFNKWGVIFSGNFESVIQGYMTIHVAIAFNEVTLKPDYWGFLVDLEESFNVITKNVINEEILDHKDEGTGDTFLLNIWNRKKLTNPNAAKNYFNENLLKWRARHQKEIDEAVPPVKYDEVINNTPIEGS